jgi:hypothetical protein
MDAGISYSGVRNPKWLNAAQTMLYCEVNFDHIDFEEWSPFAAVEAGDYNHTHQIWAECVAGDYGPIADFEAPADITGSDAQAYLRLERNRRLADCDWWANSDRTMTAEQTAYRQALRDLPANSPDATLRWEQPPEDAVLEQTIGMPHGYTVWVNVTWPTKP